MEEEKGKTKEENWFEWDNRQAYVARSFTAASNFVQSMNAKSLVRTTFGYMTRMSSTD